ncbi:MAG: glycine C-acetyltransferase [Bacilli bacterium]
MVSMNNLQYLEDKIAELKAQGVYRKLPINTGPCANVIHINNKEIINLSSNNYLGFANHPRVIQAAKDAVDKYGAGAGSVRTIVGNQDLLEKLEEVLAEFKREEAVTCFQSGFNCNLGTIPAITDAGDLIISDEKNHASIIDGVRLSKADRAVYRHNDMADLERVLKEKRAQYRNVLIITDGVFSMDGDIANLPKIVELAKKHQALTYVDDAHGSGVLGQSGRGTVDYYHLHGQVDFIIGTLSKAIGVVGGYVASKQIVKDWLLHRARTLLFSTALPPAAIGATIESVKMLMESEEYTKKLWDNARYFKQALANLGFDLGHSETPITPVMVGKESLTMELSRGLLAEGVFVSGIVFPTVPSGQGRLRVMLSASHTKENLDFAIKAFEKVGKQLGIIKE